MEPQCALSYDKHPSRLKEMMKENLNIHHFADVTLVGDDMIPFQGHRYILGGLSSVFNELFLQNPENSSLIFLDGWRSCEIQCLLDFVYLGQASLNNYEVDNFIQNAKSLKIKKFDENLQESFDEKSGHKVKEEPSKTDNYIRDRMSEFEATNIKDLDDRTQTTLQNI